MKWLGLGAGRCGTQSLAKMFGAEHEAHRFPWLPTEATQRVAIALGAGSGPACVGWTYLSHVHFIRAGNPRLPIVTLRRSVGACARSHTRVCWGYDRVTQFGRNRLGPPFEANAAYPLLPSMPTDTAWKTWVVLADSIMDSLPGPRFDLWTDELNDRERLLDVRDFLKEHGVNIPNCFEPTPLHYDPKGQAETK